MAKETLSALEEAKKLRERLDALKGQAVSELLEKRKQIDLELAEWGYQEKASTKKGKSASDKVCQVCGAVGHDSRFHRKELIAKKKKA